MTSYRFVFRTRACAGNSAKLIDYYVGSLDFGISSVGLVFLESRCDRVARKSCVRVYNGSVFVRRVLCLFFFLNDV